MQLKKPELYLTDTRISLKAKGVLAIMKAWPENEVRYISEITGICSDSCEAVKNAINELERFGYVKVVSLCCPNKPARSRTEYAWEVIQRS